ncbi:hypothetical protein A374_07939 [Fictibacillus macauensis ZFHKF-1]|uniref:Uncharacterized protein n=1 Tax=Fictibacillus macauensis ZFHKF-1 TaxID=1196324 RepID=I8AJN4_9BACL|nr:hypothetical protein [Fictibacillus macauensis]EIT85749.1 hypothetical protein A374_07939 [Fictibacillus macauensis ZFHKF-1]
MRERYYDLCCAHIGQQVEIATHDGQMHTGVIHHVDADNVYLWQERDRFFPLLGGALLGLGLGSIAGFAIARPRPPVYGYGYGYNYGGVAPGPYGYPGSYGGYPGAYGGFGGPGTPGGFGGPGAYGGAGYSQGYNYSY